MRNTKTRGPTAIKVRTPQTKQPPLPPVLIILPGKRTEKALRHLSGGDLPRPGKKLSPHAATLPVPANCFAHQPQALTPLGYQEGSVREFPCSILLSSLRASLETMPSNSMPAEDGSESFAAVPGQQSRTARRFGRRSGIKEYAGREIRGCSKEQMVKYQIHGRSGGDPVPQRQPLQRLEGPGPRCTTRLSTRAPPWVPQTRRYLPAAAAVDRGQ